MMGRHEWKGEEGKNRLTVLANIHIVRIRADHQPLKQKLRRTIRNQTISLHLSQTQTTIPCSSLGRLACQNCARTTSAAVHLVLHHVLQSLIVDWAEEGVKDMCFTRDAAGQVVLACVREAFLHQNLPHIFHLGAAKRSSVLEIAGEDTCFA